MKLLSTVRQDLEDVVAITSSGKKQTNHHRALIATLTRGMIPASWLRYKVPDSCSVAAWVTDFSSRVKQLTSVSKAVSSSGASQLKSFNVWMGGEDRSLMLSIDRHHVYFKVSSIPKPSSLRLGSVSPRPTPGPWRSSTWTLLWRTRQTSPASTTAASLWRASGCLEPRVGPISCPSARRYPPTCT